MKIKIKNKKQDPMTDEKAATKRLAQRTSSRWLSGDDKDSDVDGLCLKLAKMVSQEIKRQVDRAVAPVTEERDQYRAQTAKLARQLSRVRRTTAEVRVDEEQLRSELKLHVEVVREIDQLLIDHGVAGNASTPMMTVVDRLRAHLGGSTEPALPEVEPLYHVE